MAGQPSLACGSNANFLVGSAGVRAVETPQSFCWAIGRLCQMPAEANR